MLTTALYKSLAHNSVVMLGFAGERSPKWGRRAAAVSALSIATIFLPNTVEAAPQARVKYSDTVSLTTHDSDNSDLNEERALAPRLIASTMNSDNNSQGVDNPATEIVENLTGIKIGNKVWLGIGFVALLLMGAGPGSFSKPPDKKK